MFKFGADIRDLRQNAYRDEQARGFIDFPGIDHRQSARGLLLGLPTVSGGAHLITRNICAPTASISLREDTFRVRPDLTLSLGVRYEYNAPPVDAQNRANVFDLATQSLVPVGTNGVPRSGYAPDRNNWAPRVGVAWSPGNRTRVFRAGYGIYYDQGALATGEGLYFNPPYFNFQVYFPLPGLPLLDEQSVSAVRFRILLRLRRWPFRGISGRLTCSSGISEFSSRSERTAWWRSRTWARRGPSC